MRKKRNRMIRTSEENWKYLAEIKAKNDFSSFDEALDSLKLIANKRKKLRIIEL